MATTEKQHGQNGRGKGKGPLRVEGRQEGSSGHGRSEDREQDIEVRRATRVGRRQADTVRRKH